MYCTIHLIGNYALYIKKSSFARYYCKTASKFKCTFSYFRLCRKLNSAPLFKFQKYISPFIPSPPQLQKPHTSKVPAV